jgi:hypothetical protein
MRRASDCERQVRQKYISMTLKRMNFMLKTEKKSWLCGCNKRAKSETEGRIEKEDKEGKKKFGKFGRNGCKNNCATGTDRTNFSDSPCSTTMIRLREMVTRKSRGVRLDETFGQNVDSAGKEHRPSYFPSPGYARLSTASHARCGCSRL